jgi:general secretion pathway protein G
MALTASRTRTAGKRGFTLIELLATITIIAILVGISLPLVTNSLKRDRETDLRRALREMRTAIDKYKEDSDLGKIEVPTDTEGYPQTLESLVDGVQWIGQAGKNLKYLRKIPVDPMTNSTDWGMRSYQDEVTSQSWGGQNVFEVYSKSEGVAFDGTLYKDW